MELPNTLAPEAHDALVAAIRIAGARGRALRLAREQAKKEIVCVETTADGADARKIMKEEGETNGTL